MFFQNSVSDVHLTYAPPLHRAEIYIIFTGFDDRFSTKNPKIYSRYEELNSDFIMEYPVLLILRLYRLCQRPNNSCPEDRRNPTTAIKVVILSCVNNLGTFFMASLIIE